jgi:hypothetical protein
VVSTNGLQQEAFMNVPSAVRLACAIVIVALGPSEAKAHWITTNGPAGAQTNVLVRSGTRLLAGTAGGGVLVAADDYTGWTAANNGLANFNILSLATGVNQTGDRMLLAGTHGGGVFASADNAETWFARNSGLTNSVVRAVAVIPDPYFGNGMVLFAGTDSGVFRSNSGHIFMISWRAVNSGLKNTLVRAFTFFFEGSDENDGMGAHDLFAGTAGGGAFYSTDGVAWWAKNTGLTNPSVAALAANSPGWGPIFAGTIGGGVFRSSSTGGGWTAVDNGLTNNVVQAVATAGTNVFAGTSGGGVFLSTNNGASWVAVNNGLPNLAVTALTIDGTNLFAATGAGVFRRPLAEMMSP